MSQTVQIVSFNIRCSWDADGINSFIHRAGMILDTVWEKKPDILCLQEAMPRSIAMLTAGLGEYKIFFNCREADFNGEGLAIAIRRDSMELHELDRFWLSPTPDIPGSRYEIQSNNPRICQTALLRHKDSDNFLRIYNNHLDHISPEARIQGIGQVLEKVLCDQARFACPFYILGDFNDFPDSEPLRFCLTHPRLPLADLTEGMGCTYHNYGKCPDAEQIDYILTGRDNASSLLSREKWTREADGIYLSDHYPVQVTVALS